MLSVWQKRVLGCVVPCALAASLASQPPAAHGTPVPALTQPFLSLTTCLPLLLPPSSCPPSPPPLPAELEVEEGDVVNNKQRVWDNAEEQAELFRAHLEELRAEGFDFDSVEA